MMILGLDLVYLMDCAECLDQNPFSAQSRPGELSRSAGLGGLRRLQMKPSGDRLK
jgi:hypothetical protein